MSCPKCKSKNKPALFTTPGAGTMLDHEDGGAYHEFANITMYAHACPDCFFVYDKSLDD